MADSYVSRWRVGRTIGRTLYIGDKCIGMVDTPELAAAIVEAMNAPSPAESEGKPDWADWMATNEYHQSLGAKWMCEAIAREYAPDEREFVHAFARKWQDPSFWRPKTSAVDVCPSPMAGDASARAPIAPVQQGIPIKEDCREGSSGATLGQPQARISASGDKPGETGAISPAMTQGIPERMGRLRVVRVLETRYASASVEITMPSPQGIWPHARGTEYVRADLLASAEAKLDHSQRKYRASCRHIEELAREGEEKRARLEAAERRIAELEQRVRIAGEDMGIVAEQHLAEGREAGIREALTHLTTEHGQWRSDSREAVIVDQCVRCVNALLDKKPEVGT